MEAMRAFFELLGYVIESQQLRAQHEQARHQAFADAWWDIGQHLARKPQRRRDAARRRAKSIGSWNKS